MSTTILIEQRAPFILQLASRVPTYAHILISVLAIILFKAIPSLTIAKPPVRVVSRKPRSGSLTSNTPTLIDTDEAVAPKLTLEDTSDKDKETHHRHGSFSAKNPFHCLRLGSSFKDARKFTVRRLSIPAKRISSHVVHALHHFTPHHHHHHTDLTPHNHHIHVEAESYFFSKKSVDVEGENDKAGAAEKVVEAETKADDGSVITAASGKEAIIGGDVAQDEAGVSKALASKKLSMTFKRAARRASVVLHITHRRGWKGIVINRVLNIPVYPLLINNEIFLS